MVPFAFNSKYIFIKILLGRASDGNDKGNETYFKCRINIYFKLSINQSINQSTVTSFNRQPQLKLLYMLATHPSLEDDASMTNMRRVG